MGFRKRKTHTGRAAVATAQKPEAKTVTYRADNWADTAAALRELGHVPHDGEGALAKNVALLRELGHEPTE